MGNFTRRAALASLVASGLTVTACDKEDDLVKITYQHLGNANNWYFLTPDNVAKYGGVSDGSPSSKSMWHVYMLRGVVNRGADAKPFTFDLKKVTLKDGHNIESANDVSGWFDTQLLPPNFTAKVAVASDYTVPYGTPALFIIKEPDDTDKASPTALIYKYGSGESVLMTPLDTSGPTFGQLNTGFLTALRAKQNEYENNYMPSGEKH